MKNNKPMIIMTKKDKMDIIAEMAEMGLHKNYNSKLSQAIDCLALDIKEYKFRLKERDDYIKRLEGTIEELTEKNKQLLSEISDINEWHYGGSPKHR